MATTSFSNAINQFVNAMHIIDELNDYLRIDGDNYDGMEETFIENMESYNADNILSSLAGLRSTLSGAIDQSGALIDNLMIPIAESISTNRTDVQGIISDLYDYMVTNSEDVKARDISFDGGKPANTLGSQVLSQSDFSSTGNWSTSGDFSVGGGNASYSHSTGSGALTQASGNFSNSLNADSWYKFVYDISNVSGDADATIDTQIAETSVTLGIQSNGNSTNVAVYFKTNDNPGDFEIDGTSSSGAFDLDNFSLNPVNIVGSGGIHRLSADKNNFPIENIAVGETLELECTQDENTGTDPGQEIFVVRYQAQQNDNIDFTAISGEQAIEVTNPDNGIGLENPSFEDLDGTIGAPDTIPGWTWSGDSSTDLNLIESDVYATSPSEDEGTARSLEITTDGTLTQTLDNNEISLTFDVPLFAVIYFNRQSSADGTLNLHVGSQSNGVDLTNWTSGNWTPLFVPSSPGQNSWPENFNEADLDIQIELTGNTTDSVYVDHLIISEFNFFGGIYFLLTQGETNFQVNDIFTYDDALNGNEAILQFWMWRFTNRYLPSQSDGSETISDP